MVQPNELRRIQQKSSRVAEINSVNAAELKYADQIIAAGYATKSTNTSTTTIPTTRGSSQPMNLSDY